MFAINFNVLRVSTNWQYMFFCVCQMAYLVGWMREDPIGTGSSYDFVFADRDEDDAEDEDDVSAAYFQS